jgi:hypothetical protein
LSSETEKIFGKSGEKREKRNENLLQFCGNCGIMSGKWGRQTGSLLWKFLNSAGRFYG